MKTKETTIAATEAWTDPDDSPPWTSVIFELAEVRDGDRLIKAATGVLKRGCPKLERPKERVTLRLDADLVDKLRERGPGWQTQANSLLRKAVGV